MIRSLLLAALAATSLSAASSSPGPLRVSPGGQYFQQADGAPFFWLGDTAWLMTQKLTRDEVKTYGRYDQDTEGRKHGEDNWRHVLDDSAKNFKAPGSR